MPVHGTFCERILCTIRLGLGRSLPTGKKFSHSDWWRASNRKHSIRTRCVLFAAEAVREWNLEIVSRYFIWASERSVRHAVLTAESLSLIYTNCLRAHHARPIDNDVDVASTFCAVFSSILLFVYLFALFFVLIRIFVVEVLLLFALFSSVLSISVKIIYSTRLHYLISSEQTHENRRMQKKTFALPRTTYVSTSSSTYARSLGWKFRTFDATWARSLRQATN